VHSIGDFIDEGVTVEVVEKEGYRITVKRTE
jgi:membrane-bound ClpP family serine protease